MRGSYEVRVHNYSRKKVHNRASNVFRVICQWILLVQVFSWTHFHLIMSLKCEGDKAGHFKKWWGRLPSVPNSLKQLGNLWDSHYLHFYLCRKLWKEKSARTQWGGLWVRSSFMSSWEDRWEELQVITQTIMFLCLTKHFVSSLSYFLRIHFYFLVKSLFSFPLATGVSCSVPELCSVQDEWTGHMIYDDVNNMDPAWRMTALLKLRVEKQQSVFCIINLEQSSRKCVLNQDSRFFCWQQLFITLKIRTFNLISHCSCTVIFVFTAYSYFVFILFWYIYFILLMIFIFLMATMLQKHAKCSVWWEKCLWLLSSLIHRPMVSFRWWKRQ